MDRKIIISLAHLQLLQSSLVSARPLWLSSQELALADFVYSLVHIAYHPGIVQQAQDHSAKTAVSPHHNNTRFTNYGILIRNILLYTNVLQDLLVN
jgi:hypothetical protein